jgi:hypothetical protein
MEQQTEVVEKTQEPEKVVDAIVKDWDTQRPIVPLSDMTPLDYQRMMKSAKDPDRQRGLVFENERQRNTMAIRKGITKPGMIDYGTLRRISMSVYVARICINSLKAKVTKTKWVVQPIDQAKRKNAKETDKRIKEVEDFFKYPNGNDETFRTLLDKMCEDLLVLDAVSIEKTRYPNGNLAELHFVDSETIRPVYDEHGNQDVEIPLPTKNGEETLPVSYLQILNNSQYGGPESGEIAAAWPKKDFIHFHMHPQGSMASFGYGLSPLEGVMSVVSNLLNSDNFNSTYFEEGAFPPVILNIVGQVQQRDLEAYKEYFYQELSGNFHRPALLASQNESKVINLKEFNNRDMQFMEYTLWLAKMLCAAFEMSPEDIGVTDTTGSKSVSEVQRDLSQAKGYGSILDLFKQVFNQEIIWKDFGYEDLEFEWAGTDNIAPLDNATIQDTALKNGSMTLNEVRLKNGDTPYDEWADKPMILTASGYSPLIQGPEDDVPNDGGADDLEPLDETEESDGTVAQPKEVGGEKPYKQQDKDDVKTKTIKVKTQKMVKSILTSNGYRVWADDRGVSQPFIFMDVLSGTGRVIKPPVAVNLQSQNLEVALTHELAEMGLNVKPVEKVPLTKIQQMLSANPDVSMEFNEYINMTPAYDSEKWKSKYGGSRKFPYYLVSDYIDGLPLSNPLLIADMKRDPGSYQKAVEDLAKLWKAEKQLVLGDRRVDQYLIGHDKRGYGFDYQFMGDQSRWEKTSTALPEALAQIPELKAIFDSETKSVGAKVKSAIKAIVNKINS